MGGGTGRLLGRVVKRDLAMHVYLSYLSRSIYMERISLPGRFSSRPGKAESRFAQRAKAGQYLSCKHSVKTLVECLTCHYIPEPCGVFFRVSRHSNRGKRLDCCVYILLCLYFTMFRTEYFHQQIKHK